MRCRLSVVIIFNRLAVARGEPTIIINKAQQLGSIHSKQLSYKQNLGNLILFTSFAKLVTA